MPTEPRADDPGALVSEAQRQHHPDCAVFGHPEDCDLEGHEGEQLMCSNDCCLNWPCLTARLATALEIALRAAREPSTATRRLVHIALQVARDGLTEDRRQALEDAAMQASEA